MTLDEAYRHCRTIAREHYENFPVASWMLPANLRNHVAAVYAFARAADDFADEGNVSADFRLQCLEEWRKKLVRSDDVTNDEPVFIALADTLKRFEMTTEPFHHLLDAFEQDVVKKDYESFDEVISYCAKSANPVGRIMLSLFRCRNDYTVPPADALCTALQLANFWQDVSRDRLKPRVYLPKDEMLKFGVHIEDVLVGKDTEEFRELMRFQVERTREFFFAAKALFAYVPLQFRVELRAVWHGGMKVLDKIAATDYNALAIRPSLSRKEMVGVFIRSLVSLR